MKYNSCLFDSSANTIISKYNGGWIDAISSRSINFISEKAV